MAHAPQADRGRSADQSGLGPVEHWLPVWPRPPYNRREGVSRGQGSRQDQARSADDLGRLRAADWPQTRRFQQGPRIAVAPFGKILRRSVTSWAMLVVAEFLRRECRRLMSWYPDEDPVCREQRVA